MPYYYHVRLMWQSRSRFWEEDAVNPNVNYGESALLQSWPMAEEVETRRGILLGNAEATVSAETALTTFRRYYEGLSENIEFGILKDWSRDPWAPGCERIDYKVGELARFWPIVMEPQGRIHFAGAYADNLRWGMEAATRSANRVAESIDKA